MIGSFVRRCLTTLTIALMILGVTGGYEHFNKMREDSVISTSGITTPATPAQKRVFGESYQGDLVFQTTTGASITIPGRRVPMAIRDSFRSVDQVSVRYLPNKPAVSRFVDAHQAAGASTIVAAVLLFLLGLVGFVVLRKTAG